MTTAAEDAGWFPFASAHHQTQVAQYQGHAEAKRCQGPRAGGLPPRLSPALGSGNAFPRCSIRWCPSRMGRLSNRLVVTPSAEKINHSGCPAMGENACKHGLKPSALFD